MLRRERAPGATLEGANHRRNQVRARVAAGQDHELRYEAGNTRPSKAEVKSAVKSAGNSRKKVEAKLVKTVHELFRCSP